MSAGAAACAAVLYGQSRAIMDLMAVPAMPPPGFDTLSPEEKLDYIHALWARFTADPEEIPIPEWHHEVIAERLAAADRGEGSARPWDAVRQDLLTKLRNVRR